jgi:hypothetical protein
METLLMIAGGVGGVAVLGTAGVMAIGGRRRSKEDEEYSAEIEDSE